MADAIVYKSNTGFTKKYAELLSGETELPCYSFKEAANSLKSGCKVIFLSWLRAGRIVGLKKAQSRYNLAAVAGVGMRKQSPDALSDLLKQNSLGSVPAFYLRGGLDMNTLRGINKLMLQMAVKVMLKDTPKDTPEAMESFDMLTKGRDFVSKDNLCDLLSWYKGQ